MLILTNLYVLAAYQEAHSPSQTELPAARPLLVLCPGTCAEWLSTRTSRPTSSVSVSAPSPGLFPAGGSPQKTLPALGTVCRAAVQQQLCRGRQGFLPCPVLVHVPLCVYRSTSTVGFPRESRISRAWILSTAMAGLGKGQDRTGQDRTRTRSALEASGCGAPPAHAKTLTERRELKEGRP